GWLLPALPLVVGTSAVAFGRFHAFGVLIATTLRYGADLAVPLFLGLALALTPTSAAAIRHRVVGDEPLPNPVADRPGRRRARHPGWRPGLAAVLLLAAAWL